MDFIENIREKASENLKTIVFPRSSDARVIEAALYLKTYRLAEPVLIYNEGASIPKSLPVIDPISDERLKSFAFSFYEKRQHKGLSEAEAIEILKDPLYFASAIVSSGNADGAVAGSISTTGDVLRSAIQVIGLKKGSNVVSSVFMMSLNNGRVYTYGDCAVVPYPESVQLATICIDSAKTHEKITGEKPKVSMLSFSTKGSAEHDRVTLVRKALEIVHQQAPNLIVDGELQFDASIVPDIAQRKAPHSEVAGQANVFIFPNLDAGNIAYKITERLAGATATGPIIQGLAKPMMDLSRGCSWQDIVNTACVCSLMGE